MSYNTKNYKDNGGDRIVITGELVITEGGRLCFNETEFRPAMSMNQSTATTIEELVFDLNMLINRLMGAGLMEYESVM